MLINAVSARADWAERTVRQADRMRIIGGATTDEDTHEECLGFAERVSEQALQMLVMADMTTDDTMKRELLGFAKRFAEQAAALRKDLPTPWMRDRD